MFKWLQKLKDRRQAEREAESIAQDEFLERTLQIERYLEGLTIADAEAAFELARGLTDEISVEPVKSQPRSALALAPVLHGLFSRYENVYIPYHVVTLNPDTNFEPKDAVVLVGLEDESVVWFVKPGQETVYWGDDASIDNASEHLAYQSIYHAMLEQVFTYEDELFKTISSQIPGSNG